MMFSHSLLFVPLDTYGVLPSLLPLSFHALMPDLSHFGGWMAIAWQGKPIGHGCAHPICGLWTVDRPNGSDLPIIGDATSREK